MNLYETKNLYKKALIRNSRRVYDRRQINPALQNLPAGDKTGGYFSVSHKSEEEVTYVINTYGNLLYRTGYILLGNPHDVQDVLQDVLIKYMEKAPSFHDREHEKAWLLKVTANLCRDCLRFQKRHSYVNLDQLDDICSSVEEKELLNEVISLPAKWKTVFLLHYVEGYQLKEIASIAGISENAVKKRLQRGREALKQQLSKNGGLL